MYNISAQITGIKYTPFLCRELQVFDVREFDKALESTATFILKINKHQIAVSWWVSAKRTRSYPYARVYDSLGFSGKRLTIIPIMKDEGAAGDRDFLQWDTVSLMSLIGVYVIIGYYTDASLNPKYPNKITNQRYDTKYLLDEIQKILSYQSDALHWNLSQLEKAAEVGEKALESYMEISKKLGVAMHSFESVRRRIKKLKEGKEVFLKLSRDLAEKAQKRETVTIQPKEKLEGNKARITIKNYLGGEYFFTCDEVEIHGNDIYLVEGKHTERGIFPSLNDIKDGLLKMILLTNLKNVKIENKHFNPIPILKLTTKSEVDFESLSNINRKILKLLKKEAQNNGFKVLFNNQFLNDFSETNSSLNNFI